MSNLIPEGWSLRTLSDLAFVDQNSLKSNTEPDYKFRYIDIASVKTGQISIPTDYIYFKESPSRARKCIRAGDVLMSTVRPNLQAFSYFDKEGDDFVASTGFAVISAKKSSSGRFLYQSILSDDVTRQIESLVAGSNYPTISSVNVKSLEILSPPLPEQQKIAAILSSVDEVIEKTRAQIDKLKDLKTGMMQELLTRGVGVDGVPHTEFKDSPVGRIPAGWDVFTMEDILARIIDYRGKSPPKSELGIPLITAKNIRKGYIDQEPREYIYEGQYSSWMVRGYPAEGDVFITTEAPLGNVARVPKYKFAIGQRVLTLSPSELITSDYLYYIMQSRYFCDQLDLQSTGSTVAGIKQSTFRKILIAVPSKTEQINLVEPLNGLNHRIDSSLLKLSQMLELKKALMQDLLTGKVRVKLNESAAL